MVDGHVVHVARRHASEAPADIAAEGEAVAVALTCHREAEHERELKSAVSEDDGVGRVALMRVHVEDALRRVACSSRYR